MERVWEVPKPSEDLSMSEFIKKAYAVSMNYELTEAEKMYAEKSLLLFNQCSKQLNEASESLNKMGTPFEDNPEMTGDEVEKKRFFLRKFRDDTNHKFNKFKLTASQSVATISHFDSDPTTVKMLKSFNLSINELNEMLSTFTSAFDDLKKDTFAKEMVQEIKDIQDKSKEIKTLIDDRIKNHIEKNMLNKSWNSGPEYIQHQVEKKTPLVLKLFEERQKALETTRKS